MNLNKIEELYNEMYNQYKIKDWAKQIRKKFNYTCQHCNKTNLIGHDCHSHHVMDKKYYPEYMYDLDNGICLCSSCHSSLHNKGKDNPMYGKHYSEEAKMKMSKDKSGKNNPMYGVHRYGVNSPHYGKGKPVVQLDKVTLEIISEYSSLSIASEKTKVDLSNMSACCRGALKSAGGFLWKYKQI